MPVIFVIIVFSVVAVAFWQTKDDAKGVDDFLKRHENDYKGDL